MKNRIYYIAFLFVVCTFFSCWSSKKVTGDYYRQNETMLQSIQQRFKQLYEERPFSAEIQDKAFTKLGLEIMTDTMRYIYKFNLNESSLSDTLVKYNFNVQKINELINDMKNIRCTWITNLDYYENRQKKYLVFISIRHKELESSRSDKYFTLAFFESRQFFDNKRRLLNKQDRKDLRKINGQIFYKINDRVCYAVAGSFR